MNRRTRGGALAKYLLAIFFVALLVAFFYWKNTYGIAGQVQHLDFNTADHIVFLRQTGGQTNLYIAGADGKTVKPLTNDDVPKRMPAWSPDGRSICYAAQAKSDNSIGYQLFVLGSGAPNQITYGSISKDMPQWQPSGKMIGFLAGGSIKVVEPNGSNLEQVYPPPHKSSGTSENASDDQSAADPLRAAPIDYFRWSPGGSALMGVQVAEGDNAISTGRGGTWGKSGSATDQTLADPESAVLLPALEAKPLLLPGSDSNQTRFAWFPNGQQVAVAVSSSRNIHALLAYSTDDVRVTPVRLYVAQGMTAAPRNPAVSPDGTKVAVEMWRLTSAEDSELLGIAVFPANPDKPLLVQTPADVAKVPLIVKGHATNPQWSPDGARLLYMLPGKTGAGRDIWVSAADGSGAVNITNGAGDNYDPVWSPAHR